MSTFKLAKKDALSDTRSNIYDLHEKKLEYFESEKKKLNEYIYLLEKCKQELNFNKINELELKINNIQNDFELNEYLLDFFKVINVKDSD